MAECIHFWNMFAPSTQIVRHAQPFSNGNSLIKHQAWLFAYLAVVLLDLQRWKMGKCQISSPVSTKEPHNQSLPISEGLFGQHLS